MLLVKLRASPFNVNVIVVYAPTVDTDEAVVDQFYGSLKKLMKCCKSQEVTIVVGNWNAKVGEERTRKITGPFGLGERNERRYTWTQAGAQARNQIDYILINERFCQAVKHSQAYSGADINSDHNPVIAKIRLSLKRVPKPVRKRKFMLRSLTQNPEIKEAFKNEVLNNIEVSHANVEARFENFKKSISEAAEHYIPREEAE
ncbi:craniofacial development protein 2-like [Penaeus indicus]|uniref:craniofacial development protein 2-like n=1 Tax=Penaeus indicus TaxID=29960 RepID=UPI00300CC432